MQNENHWYIIVNPAAGNGEAKRLWPGIKSILTEAFPYASIVYSQYRDHALELVAEAVEAGFRKIMAVGGDGTNHEVANGILMQNTVPSTEITYVLFPVGTGNDWIKTHGIPKDTNQWLKMVHAGKTFQQDVGLLEYHQSGVSNLRYFVNVSGLA
ncbi:MAG: diacylglycerol kinase family lipid kinase, partial [Bacteroidetes bacterium]